MKTLLAWILGFASMVWITVAIMAVGVLVRAWALCTLWDWFVVPTFGANPLTLPVGAGLIAMSYLLTAGRRTASDVRAGAKKHRSDDDDDDDDEDEESAEQVLKSMGQAIISELLVPVIAVCLGWVFLQMVGA